MKKHIANMITSVRVVLSLIMLGFKSFTDEYIILFCISGFTDLADGPIARATGSESRLGAGLDTAADVLLYVSMAKIMVQQKYLSLKTLGMFILPLMGIIAAAVISKVKFSVFCFPHTVISKLFGFGCFLMPLIVRIGIAEVYLKLLALLATVMSADIIMVHINSDEPDPDALSALAVKRK